MELPSIARLLGRAANALNACREPASGEGGRCSFSFPLLSMGKGRRSSHLGGVDPELECHSPPAGHRKFVEIVMFSQNILQTESV